MAFDPAAIGRTGFAALGNLGAFDELQAYLFGVELSNKGSGVCNTPYKALPLQGNQRLANHRRPHLHLLGQLPFYNGVTGLQFARKESIFQGSRDAIRQRHGRNFLKD